jgi:hypothetical protein
MPEKPDSDGHQSLHRSLADRRDSITLDLSSKLFRTWTDNSATSILLLAQRKAALVSLLLVPVLARVAAEHRISSFL